MEGQAQVMSGNITIHKSVPCHDFDTWRQRDSGELIQAGDVLVDMEGQARGPIARGWAGVGQRVSRYTTSLSGSRPPARAVLAPP